MFCQNCGSRINPGHSFCPSCGVGISPVSAPYVAGPGSPSAPGRLGSPRMDTTYKPIPATPGGSGYVKVKVKKSNVGLIIGVIVSLVAICLGYLFFFTNFFKSDKELIRSRIESFVADYNDGDMESFMKNFDAKTRSKLESSIGIGESLFGGITDFDIEYADLFGLGMSVNDDEMMVIKEIRSIEFTSSDAATVTVIMKLNNAMGGVANYSTETTTFEMVKEDTGFLNHDWYVKTVY